MPAVTDAPEADIPFVSVVIPTYNRRDSLLCTLESIGKQTYPAECFEVIVVDDGGSDGTDQLARVSYPFRLVYCRQTNQGSAAARNHGVDQSRGDILVFVDDDMTLAPGYLAGIANRTAPHTIVMGVLQPYEPSNTSIYARYVALQIAEAAARAPLDEYVPFSECTSNNLTVQRDDFVQSGLWQDVLGDGPTLWGDVEFGYRAWKQGCRFLRTADARIIHRDRHVADLASATRRAYHASRIVQPLFALHPEIKGYLPMFLDKGSIEWSHDPPALILRKLARQIASSRSVMWAMEKSIPSLEYRAPGKKLLVLLYRWVTSGYIYHGYRAGLQDATHREQRPEYDHSTP
jgi:glycosyltransferase involved in cell wall biosynthesis